MPTPGSGISYLPDIWLRQFP